MKLPVSMLREFVSTSLTPEALGDLLTMAGFELEGLETVEGEAVLDVKVIANRGDGLSALGLAREILAKDQDSKPTDLYLRAAGRFDAAASQDAAQAGPKVVIETSACTRYAGVTVQDVQNGDSPEWLQKRLRQAGQRPISLLVDLTNYVMLMLGQPLHAFDQEKLHEGRIVVREAREGEKLTTLDEREHTLKPGMMMICDADRPVAVAGVMGGLETEVGSSTRTMLLESAHFSNVSVRATRKALGLNTEASYRFERSVDPEGVVAAIRFFLELYGSITGQTAGISAITDVYPVPPVRRTVPFRPARARMILGLELTANQCAQYLSALGFELSSHAPDDGAMTLDVVPPTWRPDVNLEEDVIEEVGRVHGYDKIGESRPQGTTPRGGSFGLYAVIDTAKKTMLRCGLDQMMSHSLRDQHPLDFNPDRRVTVRNPHSPEMAYLRDSLLPGLAEAALRNGGRNVHLFEIGKVFVKGEYQMDESPELSILITGEMQDAHFGLKQPPVADFWTLKGMIEELGKLVRDDVTFDLPRDPDRRFHPTRQAGVLVDQGRLWVGTIGQIHPDVAEGLGLPHETFMAEIDLLVFFQNPDTEVHLKPISRNPAVRRDLAFVISKDVEYRAVRQAVREACGAVLERQWLFDVYEGKGIPEGSHSLAIALQLRKLGENFTDQEANEVRDQAKQAIEKLGGVLR